MTEHLTKQLFLDNIFDYEKKKEWDFQGELPCVIDFYADWCGPCKLVSPVLEELSDEYQGKVNFYKIDTEAEQELAAVFGIRSIPSLLFIYHYTLFNLGWNCRNFVRTNLCYLPRNFITLIDICFRHRDSWWIRKCKGKYCWIIYCRLRISGNYLYSWS